MASSFSHASAASLHGHVQSSIQRWTFLWAQPEAMSSTLLHPQTTFIGTPKSVFFSRLRFAPQFWKLYRIPGFPRGPTSMYFRISMFLPSINVCQSKQAIFAFFSNDTLKTLQNKATNIAMLSQAAPSKCQDKRCLKSENESKRIDCFWWRGRLFLNKATSKRETRAVCSRMRAVWLLFWFAERFVLRLPKRGPNKKLTVLQYI